jgi:hypothetical protein
MADVVKRSWVWVLVCIALIVGALLVWWLIYPRHRDGPFWAKYQQVRLGMAEKEVEDILGPPAYEEYPGGGFGPPGLRLA